MGGHAVGFITVTVELRFAPTAAAELEKSKLYSEEMGLNLTGGEHESVAAFYAASFSASLFPRKSPGARFHAFVDHGLTTPTKILAAGWDTLVNPIMREGGYVRYDESKSRSIILNTCQMLVDRYDMENCPGPPSKIPKNYMMSKRGLEGVQRFRRVASKFSCGT